MTGAATALGLILLGLQTSTQTIGDFTYVEQTDPINDSLTVGAVLRGQGAQLSIACDHARSRTVYVAMETERYLARSVVDRSPRQSGDLATDLATLLGGITGDTFQYRVDEDESHNARSEYEGLRTAFVEGRAARAFAERLADGSLVHVRVQGVSGEILVSFSAHGSRAAIRRVAERCGDSRLIRRLGRSRES